MVAPIRPPSAHVKSSPQPKDRAAPGAAGEATASDTPAIDRFEQVVKEGLAWADKPVGSTLVVADASGGQVAAEARPFIQAASFVVGAASEVARLATSEKERKAVVKSAVEHPWRTGLAVGGAVAVVASGVFLKKWLGKLWGPRAIEDAIVPAGPDPAPLFPKFVLDILAARGISAGQLADLPGGLAELKQVLREAGVKPEAWGNLEEMWAYRERLEEAVRKLVPRRVPIEPAPPAAPAPAVPAPPSAPPIVSLDGDGI